MLIVATLDKSPTITICRLLCAIVSEESETEDATLLWLPVTDMTLLRFQHVLDIRNWYSAEIIIILAVINNIRNDKPHFLLMSQLWLCVETRSCATQLCKLWDDVMNTDTAWLKEKFVFWHIKPYDQDIYDSIWCSTALLRWTVQSQEQEFIRHC